MPMKNFNAQQGFTLLEALIAMFLTAGSILGLGILQIKSTQQSQLAMQRTIANIQANDLVDRMWANRCSLSTQYGNIKSSWQTRWNPAQAGTLDTNQMAMHQILKSWQGTVTQPDTTKQRYEVVISWVNDKAAAGTAVTQQSFTYNFTLPACTT